MTSQTDSDGKTTDYYYDAEGRCIQTTDSDGQTTTYQYDLDGNQTSMTDPDGNTTTTAYDLDGNKISQTVTNSSGATVGSQQWSYDADGNCTSSTDADGRTTTYQYDVNDQLTGEQWYDAQGNCTNTVQYSYDSLDELLDVSDDFSHSSYTYNALGRETSETIQNQGQPTVVLTDSYDAAGTNATGDDLRTGLSATIDGTPDFRNSYAYNADGQLGQVVQEGQAGGNAVAYKQVDFGYNADDQVAFDRPLRLVRQWHDAGGTLGVRLRRSREHDGSDGLGGRGGYERAGGLPLELRRRRPRHGRLFLRRRGQRGGALQPDDLGSRGVQLRRRRATGHDGRGRHDDACGDLHQLGQPAGQHLRESDLRRGGLQLRFQRQPHLGQWRRLHDRRRQPE